MCLNCNHSQVCKIIDTLAKFDEEAKKSLGVDITMDACINYESDSDRKED